MLQDSLPQALALGNNYAIGGRGIGAPIIQQVVDWRPSIQSTHQPIGTLYGNTGLCPTSNSETPI